MRTRSLPYSLVFLLLILGYSCKKDKDKTPDPVLSISRTDLQVGNDAGYTDTVVIRSNIDWTISASDSANPWLSVEPVRKAGRDSTIVTIKVTAANTSPLQTATLTITPVGSGLQPLQIKLTRKAYKLVWQKCYGGSAYDLAYSTVILPNGQFVTAGITFSDDGDNAGNTATLSGWTLRAAGSDGTRIWQTQMESPVIVFQSITASPDGGTVSLGYGGAGGPRLDNDLYVVRYDADGKVIWKKQYGGSMSETPMKIIATADGGYLISGDTFSKDGIFSTNQGGRDLYVAKLDANGNVVWQKIYGTANDDEYATTAACSDGGYIVTGSIVGTVYKGDVLVMKIDANGNTIWSKMIGGSQSEQSSAIISDTDGGCILSGYTTSKDGDVVKRTRDDNDMDAWVVKLTQDGKIGWQSVLGGTGYDAGFSMVRLPNGNIAIGGVTSGMDGAVSVHGTGDIWVAVINNTGKIVWQKAFGSSSGDYNTDITAASDGSILVTNYVERNDGDVSGYHGTRDAWIFKLQ